jgi:hypothetical protein
VKSVEARAPLAERAKRRQQEHQHNGIYRKLLGIITESSTKEITGTTGSSISNGKNQINLNQIKESTTELDTEKKHEHKRKKSDKHGNQYENSQQGTTHRHNDMTRKESRPTLQPLETKNQDVTRPADTTEHQQLKKIPNNTKTHNTNKRKNRYENSQQGTHRHNDMKRKESRPTWLQQLETKNQDVTRPADTTEHQQQKKIPNNTKPHDTTQHRTNQREMNRTSPYLQPVFL